jgi:hypothetical protein
VKRAAQAALTYLAHARASGAGEFYAIQQLAASAPSLARTLIRASWQAGDSEFTAVMMEYDHAHAQEDPNVRRFNVRREAALEAFVLDGDSAAAAA